MKYSNEIKVGVSIVVAIVLLFLGVRYLQDLPAFGNTYELVTEFVNAEGVLTSTPVQIRGVRVGKISRIGFNEDKSKVRLYLTINDEFQIPEDSFIFQDGIAALGGVKLEITPGSSDDFLVNGDTIEGHDKTDLIGELSGRATEIADNLDRILTSTGSTLDGVQFLMDDPNSELRTLFSNLSNTTQSLQRTLNETTTLIQSQQESISNTLQHVESITADLSRFTSENTDSLSLAVSNLNDLLTSAKTSIAALDTTFINLNAISTKMANGEGSVGKLMDDNAALYRHLDSTIVSLNQLLLDLQENPRRYLRGLVKVF